MNGPRRHMCWQSKRFYWGRAPGWRAVGKGTQENCSAAWLAVLGFMVMGFVSGWPLANHSNSESFLVAHASLSQDGSYREGFWEVDRQAVSPLNLSRTLPVGGGLLVPYSLSGPPVIKQLMQMATMVPGQGGRFQSLCSPYQFLLWSIGSRARASVAVLPGLSCPVVDGIFPDQGWIPCPLNWQAES